MGRGAGVTMSITSADGIFVIDKDSEGIEAGTKVKVEILKDLKSIDKTLVSIGSHDVIMDIIGDSMSKIGYDLSSTHVGSMGGIMALKRGETHIAPIHLLDENGEYNISYVKKYLGDYVIVKLVKRIQGLMVKKGNPLKIKDFNDLARVRYVNRQKGAGTRLLLDYYLKKYNMAPESINGYGREEITHLTVAAQIAGGSADCGMGVLSAAQYMGLDFIQLCSEDYDIALHPDIVTDKRFEAFYGIITSNEFKTNFQK
jgi:putative molybdopterin biosynthesis protein